MTRPRKSTVDYFPHTVNHGKTMFILESKWGNDGYATWFKILEKIGDKDNHYIDLRNQADIDFLCAYCRVSCDTLMQILNQCAVINAIDAGLWRHKLIYSQNFIDGVADAYRRRKQNPPTKEDVLLCAGIVIDGIYPQTKLNETKLNEIKEKEKEKPSPDKSGSSYSPDFETFWKAYPKKSGSKKAAFDNWKKLNGQKPPIETILNAIEAQSQWRRNTFGKFRPEWKDPERWIKNRMWEAELTDEGDEESSIDRWARGENDG